MIRNAVIHIANEQPLVADLYEMPTAGDISLICTNIRMLDGKKPVFIDHMSSVFVFPYATIRFLEIPARSATGLADAGGGGDVVPVDSNGNGAPPVDEPDLELDEDFLRRIREA